MKTLDRKASEILRGLLALQTTKIDTTDGVVYACSYRDIDRTENYPTTFRWLITDSRMEMSCSDPEMIIAPAQRKASSSFRTTTVMIIWVWSNTALNGRKRAFAEPSFAGSTHHIR